MPWSSGCFSLTSISQKIAVQEDMLWTTTHWTVIPNNRLPWPFYLPWVIRCKNFGINTLPILAKSIWFLWSLTYTNNKQRHERLFKTLFQHNYAYRNTLILVNRMPFKLNLSYTIWTKDLVHGLSFKKKKNYLQSGLFFIYYKCI